MISAVVGRPGGGKSYETVRYHILPAALEDQRKVITNIPVQKEYIAKIHGREFADLITIVDGNFHEYGKARPFSEAQHFLEYDDWKNDKGQGVLFCIDEAHLSIGRNAQAELLEYLSMHRHYGHDIIVLTQNQRKLNRDLRDMVEVVYHCAKMTTYGEDSYIRKTYHGLDNMRDPVAIQERNYDKEYFPYYQSHTKSTSSVIEAEAKDTGAKRNPFKKATKIMFGISGLIFCLGIFSTFADDEPTPYKPKEPDQQSPQKALPANPNKQQATNQNHQEQKPPEPKRARTKNEEIELTIEERSKQYHPFHKVSLHIEGSYSDIGTGESAMYFSASTNGQRLFSITLRDLFLAGYTVSVLNDCTVEITYYKYTEFLTCDTPKVSVNTELASN